MRKKEVKTTIIVDYITSRIKSLVLELGFGIQVHHLED
jgi:hypothetical protein